jgi:uncharacterized protein
VSRPASFAFAQYRLGQHDKRHPRLALHDRTFRAGLRIAGGVCECSAGAIIKMTQLVEDKGFAKGIRLFNRGNFFEAHEVWEQEWKVAEGEEKVFYQAIIQAAVALLHIQRGNYAGGVSVYLKSWAKLALLPEVWMGIELGQFRSDLRRYFALFRHWPGVRGENCQSALPGQISSLAQLPTIRWALA